MGHHDLSHRGQDTANVSQLKAVEVSMLQRLGIESDKFGSSTGTLAGLEVKLW